MNEWSECECQRRSKVRAGSIADLLNVDFLQAHTRRRVEVQLQLRRPRGPFDERSSNHRLFQLDELPFGAGAHAEFVDGDLVCVAVE